MLAIILLFLHAFAVRVDVGVPGDAHNTGLRRHIVVEEIRVRKTLRYDIFNKRVAEIIGIRRQWHHPGRIGGHFYHAEKLALSSRIQCTHDIELAVAKVGEGMAWIHHQGREHGGHGTIEIASYRHIVAIIKIGGVHSSEAKAHKLALDSMEGLLLASQIVRDHVEEHF